MATKKDYYDVLGVDRTASDDEIKKAFRQKAKGSHPDLNPDDPSAEQRFKDVNEAYEVLSDTTKKQRYDSFGHAGVDPSYGGGAGAGAGGGSYYSGGIDFGDIFNDIFGSGFGSGVRTSRRNPNAPSRGQDREDRVSISFKEAVKGTNKHITFSRLDTCDKCDGKGAENPDDIVTCKTCNGMGTVTSFQQTVFGAMETQTTCSSCNGIGQTIANPCTKCSGKKRVTKTETIAVDIPEGIDDRQAFAVPGKGDAGLNGGPYGDLIVEVVVRPDPIFKRDRNSIYCDVPITFSQAALGDKIQVPTVDGPVEYTIKPGTQSETIFRLRGKGVKSVGTRVRGDQFVTVKVEIPTKLNKQQKKAIGDLDSLFGDQNFEHYEKRKGFFDKLKDWVNE